MDLSKLARESGNNQEKFEAAIADCTKRIKILREKKEQVIRQLNFNEEEKRKWIGLNRIWQRIVL